MFTKPEQPETVRFSNYSGLSFSLSCSSFGRAPLPGLPPAPSCCSTAADLESHVGTREKCHIQTQGWIRGAQVFLPQQEQGGQAGDSSSHISSRSVITRAHGIHVRVSGTLRVLQFHQHPHFQRIKPLCALLGGKTPAQAAKRGERCPIPGVIQGQI